MDQLKHAAPKESHSSESPRLLEYHESVKSEAPAQEEPAIPQEINLKRANDELIWMCLEKHDGKVKEAAAELGISERTIYRKLADKKKNGK